VFDDDDGQYMLIINQEDQYSIWPAAKDVPAGWTTTEHAGTKAECVAKADEVWTDMRPLSLRQ